MPNPGRRSFFMDSSEILEQTRTSAGALHGWVVLPLGRDKVMLGIVGWILGIILGMGLFTVLAFIMIPYNYQHGTGPAIFSTILMGILLFTGLGSLWALIIDVSLLRTSDKHIIVITPESFFHQHG